MKRWNSLSEEVISSGSVNTFKRKVGRFKKDEGLTHGLMSAGTKADSEGTLVRPNQVNNQVNEVNKQPYYRSTTFRDISKSNIKNLFLIVAPSNSNISNLESQQNFDHIT